MKNLESKYRSHLRACLKSCIPNDLSYDDYYRLKRGDCYYCGIESYMLKYYAYYMSVRTPWMTIDRKDPKGGYTRDNCVSACFVCNRSKSNIFTCEEFREVAIKYLKPKWMKHFDEANEDFGEDC